MDTISVERRSENMRRIKSADTTPEMIVRRLAHRLGYRFRLHRRDLPGKPDMVFSGLRKVIFVHGCFWHQHSDSNCGARPPRSNNSYWEPKLARNVARDQRNVEELDALGWDVLTVWECETRMPNLADRLHLFLR